MRLLIGLLFAAALAAQTTTGGLTPKGAVDASGATTTKPSKSGTSLPGTCSTGETYFKTDATAGINWYLCTATNTWTVSSGRRVCSLIVGADNGTALVDADLGPQGQQCKIPFAATVAEIDVNADAGTPSVIVRKKHCATFAGGVCTSWTSTDLLSGALAAAASNFDACSNTGGTTGLDGGTTCSATLQNTSLAVGDWIELKSGTAGGTAKRVSVDVIYTVN